MKKFLLITLMAIMLTCLLTFGVSATESSNTDGFKSLLEETFYFSGYSGVATENADKVSITCGYTVKDYTTLAQLKNDFPNFKFGIVGSYYDIFKTDDGNYIAPIKLDENGKVVAAEYNPDVEGNENQMPVRIYSMNTTHNNKDGTQITVATINGNLVNIGSDNYATDFYFCLYATDGKQILFYSDNGWSEIPDPVSYQESMAPVVQVKLENTDKYLYRVGNKNTVSLGSLFEVIAGKTVDNSSVDVTFEKVQGDVSGTFTKNDDNWTAGTIQFAGTGVVKVNIQTNGKIAVPLTLEVVDAKNATTATSATNNNVVLLNDISGEFTVSNGYTFYGNGFKVTCSGNGSYGSKALSYGFITVSDGGVLDNVQIICDIFPESYLYTTEMEADSSGNYPYAKSAVAITGNSTISNCYIYGARNNIFVGSGNVTIENTVTECGSLSNIQIKSSEGNTITLNNVTTIQYKTTSSYDTSKTILGFGIVVGDNESASNPILKLLGDLKQYNWVTNDDTSVSNTYAKNAISAALKVEKYQHTINGTTAVNMGIAYLNEVIATITDERTNRDAIPYALNSITMSGQTGQVYSISGSSITADSRYDANTDGVIPYNPLQNRVVIPDITFTGETSDALTFSFEYDSTEGKWLIKFSADLDNVTGGSYDFNFSNLSIQKYGESLAYVIKDADGNEIDTNKAITLNELTTHNYTIEITDNRIYNANGELSGTTATHTYPFVINATKTSIDPPEFTNAGTATAIRLVTLSGGDWRPAYTVLTGVSVTYWSASESKVKTVDLSTLYSSGTISSNVWTYTCDDYTLTITGGAVHTDGSVITPIVANNTLYFASTNKAFGTGTTSRNIVLTYVFTDKNASTTWNRTETVTYSELSEYDYDSFKNNGTLEEASSGGGCVTPDTLVTLADGTQKRIDETTSSDLLLVWNFYEGTYDTVPASVIINHGEDNYEILTLNFDDGTNVKIISSHGLFNATINEWVFIDSTNVSSFINDNFVKQGANSYSTVTLTGYSIHSEDTVAYSIFTNMYSNCFVEGLLSLTPPAFGASNLYVPFEIGDNLKYDETKMQSDIEKYGLYTYDDFDEYISYEQFVNLGAAYLKVSVGKGLTTWEEIVAILKTYIN